LRPEYDGHSRPHGCTNVRSRQRRARRAQRPTERKM
jgi:hypothetical protein